MSAPVQLWEGKHVKLVKEPGGKYWSGMLSGQQYAPTRFKCLGSRSDAFAIHGFATDVSVFEVEGRQNMKEVLAWALACDALYPEWLAEKLAAKEDRARRDQEARDAKEREQELAQRQRRMADPLYVALRALVDCMRYDGGEQRWHVPSDRSSTFEAARVALRSNCTERSIDLPWWLEEET